MCKNKGGVKFSPVLVDWGFAEGEGEGALFCLLLYCQFRIAYLEVALERLTPSSFCHKWHHVMSLMSQGSKLVPCWVPNMWFPRKNEGVFGRPFCFIFDSFFASFGFHLCFRCCTYLLNQVGLILGQQFVLFCFVWKHVGHVVRISGCLRLLWRPFCCRERFLG